jgi:SAM-dependent methyltransferase
MADSQLDDYRQQSLANWERLAQVWADEREFMWSVSHRVGTWLVAHVDPQPGDTILELAAGTGETGFAAAAEVGAQGRVISTDFSPQMVEAARQRGEELGLKNMEYRVVNAENMDLEDDSVDGVICRWGYMLMADPNAALAETRRVLRPDGRVAFSVWGPADRNPWSRLAAAALVERGHLTPPEPGAPGIFALADKDLIRRMVTEAGFGEPEIEDVPLSWTWNDFDAYWDFLSRMSGQIAITLGKLTDDERSAVREQLRERTREFAGSDGFSMPGLCINAATG